MTAPRLHSVPDTADQLGCSVNTVYRLIAVGDLRAVDIGTGRSKTRIRDDDLAKFIESRTQPAPKRLALAHTP